MKKSILIGSIFAAFLLVLAMIPMVVGEQTKTSIEKIINSDIITEVNEKTKNSILDYPPGWWLGVLRDILLSWFLLIITIIFGW